MDEDFQSNYSFALIFCNIEQNEIKISNVKLIEKSVIIKRKNFLEINNYEIKIVILIYNIII